MKKLIITSSFILMLGLFSCKKEKVTLTQTSQEELVTGKPSPPPPPPPNILQWQKFYGSTLHDRGESISKTSDGNGYVISATTLGNDGDVSGNHGGADAWIIKIDLAGNLIWQKTFGGSGGDYAYDIVATSDGGYIFCGATNSTDGNLSTLTNHGGIDTWVVKLSALGDIEWQKLLGGNDTERGMSVIQTASGDYLISGSTSSINGDITSNHGTGDVWIFKLNNTGGLIWQKTYGGSLNDGSESMTLIGNEVILCASSASTNGDLSTLTNHGGTDTWVFKIDLSGNLLWGKTYGGSGGEGGGTIYPCNGGYIFSTTTTSNNGDVSGNHGYADTWVVKIDGNGIKLWQKCVGGADMDNAKLIDINASGNIVLVGYTFSKNGDIPRTKADEDLWVVQLDATGK
jgi:hypothetical protein